jgi:hypothetical protein
MQFVELVWSGPRPRGLTACLRAKRHEGGTEVEVGLPSRGWRGLSFFNQTNPRRPFKLASLTFALASLLLQLASVLFHLSVMVYLLATTFWLSRAVSRCTSMEMLRSCALELWCLAVLLYR